MPSEIKKEQLLEAVKRRQIEKVLEVLGYSDINEQNEWGRTALMSIINMGQSTETDQIFHFLIEAGADLEKKDIDGFTALSYAVTLKQFARAEALIDAGASPNVSAVIHLMPSQKYGGSSVESTNWWLSHPRSRRCVVSVLSASVYRWDNSLSQKMIEKGVDVNTVGDSEISPLSMAIRCEDNYMVNYLLEHGANPNILPKKWRTYTNQEELVCPVALKKALKYGNAEAISLLINKNVRIPTYFIRSNNEVVTPLTYLFSQDKRRLMDVCMSSCFLIQSGVNIDLEDSKGRTALSYAAEQGCTAAMEYLITPQTKNKPDKKGITPMVYAYKNRNFKGMDILFKSGVSMNTQFVDPKRGINMLMDALENQDKKMVEFLLNYNPNLMQRSKTGRSILDYAQHNGELTQKIQKMYGFQIKALNPSGRGL